MLLSEKSNASHGGSLNFPGNYKYKKSPAEKAPAGGKDNQVFTNNNRIRPDSKAGLHQPEAQSPYGKHYTISQRNCQILLSI
jgi:hypothetical protein